MTESHTESQPEEHTEAHAKPYTDRTAPWAPADTSADTGTGADAAARPDTEAEGRANAEGRVDAEAEAMVAELRDRWQRAQADLDNTRKRYERQLADHAT